MERKKTHLILLVFLILFPLGLMGIGLYCCSYKKGFNLDKISSQLQYNEIRETRALSYEDKERLLKEILSQTFYYMGSGNQCYTFVSQDDKYVLKFFKMHKIIPKKWLMDFPFSLFEKYRLENVEKRQDVFETFFKSFKDAYEHLKEESGLIYVHLNKTRDLKKKVALIGYDGKKILVDLDSKEFIVQLKADRICEYLLDLRDKNKEEEIHQVVNSFLEIIALRCQRGFGDQNIGTRNNFGFVNGRAIFVDCSHFFVDNSLKHPQHLQTEILSATEKMSQWAEQFYPDLTIILQEEAQVVIDKHLKLNPFTLNQYQ
jgi:hypothetical protein